MSTNRTGGALAALLVVLVLVGLGAAAWLFRDAILARFQGEPTVVEVSPEAADRAVEKLEGMEAGGDPVELSATELSSLLRYRAPVWASNAVGDPAVEMSGDTIRVTGVVPTDRLPSHPELDAVRGLLPDSSRFEIEGSLRPLERGRVALQIGSVELAGIPIPARYYPDVLRRIGRRDEPGLPSSALALRLPGGAASARVQDGRLILTP